MHGRPCRGPAGRSSFGGDRRPEVEGPAERRRRLARARPLPMAETPATQSTEPLAATQEARRLELSYELAILAALILLKGFKSVVTDTSKYREVSGSPFPSNDDINRAVQLVEQMITANPNLTAIVMVGGWPLFAPEAYKNAVKKKEADIKAGRFTVVSFDTLEPELRLVKEGFVSGLVGQRPYQMGVRSIELLNDIVVKKMKPAQTFYNTGVDIVTRENVDRFLKK